MPPAPPLVRVRVWVFTLLLAASSAACVGLAVDWWDQRQMLAAERMARDEQALALTHLQARLAQFQGAERAAQRWQAIQTIRDRMEDPSPVLSALVQRLPASARVTRLQYRSGTLDGEVAVRDLADAAALVRKLQDSSVFHQVVIHAVTAVGQAAAGNGNFSGVSVSFSITMAARAPRTLGAAGE